MIRIATILVVILFGFSLRPQSQGISQPGLEEHTAWVSQSLVEMETIKPGMTRADLLKSSKPKGDFRRHCAGRMSAANAHISKWT